jgi:hypothetical protein
VTLLSNGNCFVLQNLLNGFTGKLSNNKTFLNWSVNYNQIINHFEIEQSLDGINFNLLGNVNGSHTDINIANYNASFNVNGANNSYLYYRLKIYGSGDQYAYSKVIRLFNANSSFVTITPNPVKDEMNVNILSPLSKNIFLEIYDLSGRLMKKMTYNATKGNTNIKVFGFQNWPAGLYSVKVSMDKNIFIKKMILQK